MMFMPIAKIAASMSRRGMPYMVSTEELEADAMLGLLNAIERWDHARGPFIPYCFISMRSAILDGLRQRDSISRWGRVLLTRLSLAQKLYREEHLGDPTIRELARLAGLPVKVCMRHFGLVDNVPFVSIEAVQEMGKNAVSPDSALLDEWLAEPDPDRYFRDVEADDFIEWLLGQIEDPRAHRICHSYLVGGIIQRDIGLAEGLSESRVFQILEECRAVWLERSEWLREEREARDGSDE